MTAAPISKRRFVRPTPFGYTSGRMKYNGVIRRKLAMMTLGCPAWDLPTIISRAAEYGFDGVDFRGIRDQIDITRLPEFTTGVAETRRRFADAGLAVCTIASSIKVCDPDARAASLDEARRTIAVARELGVPNVRVFGGGPVEQIGRERAAAIGVETMEAILALDGAAEIRWLFETHDHWIRSADCALLLGAIPDPAFGALWDIGHTSRVGGESPAETYAALGDRVGYVHVKDASHDPDHPQAMADGWRYVPVGTGSLPLAGGIEILAGNGYGGWVGFEHEKRWHPELPEPEVAFPHFVRWFRSLATV